MKRDLKREITTYRARQGELAVVEVPPLQYLAVDGRGDPNTSAAYADALAALYPVAYQVKFLSRAELERDYVVMPLEALWWSEDLTSFTSERDKARWEWTLLTMVPDEITADHVDRARAAVAAKGSPSPELAGVRLERLEEGLCVQTLHVGSYDDEGPVLAAVHDELIPALGLRMRDKHHEIYLNDARRTPPEKLRTILRQPVARADP